MLRYLPHHAVASLVLTAFVIVWRSESDDPTWEARWSALSPAERARLAAAARSGALLSFLLLGLWRLPRNRRAGRGLRETISHDHFP